MVNEFEKKAYADVAFGIRWSRLYTDADAVVTSTWEVPEGITKKFDSISRGVCSVTLTSGTPGTSYVLKNTVTTRSGQIDCEQIIIKVVDGL